ncbi:MAG: hypothetical protein E5V91_31265 [Mesorhizobium sp.]|nr:hypothetical protein EJ068_24760 [Mesorhizobium sp. M2A.F.Ca.ET.043.02.1.1]RUW34559.1 hypothetical protein EOA37_29315 [Mesorhizobium sp. M2A.F.Ca.ET.015.02.1.1]RUW65363.1 hypothetical protein EOA28_33080 [Mesorhizobium sp. M2A.F.Ca.ET.067.02.1.1]RVC90915.1 hypothetical protein EN739_31805 [Mesorhizobium sp. M2A.F.Ca.ET.017.03.2.1]RVC96871.1 hypothetical protein EN753_30765 [Mesorhizobium sp. M2A.F.Ca.ET.029.05.1.1]RWB48755.1 MAG: hypothetical protein EOQ46_00025 [Mesorhizobium sp.]
MQGSRFLLPVTIRGEVPGRAMRGSADLDVWPPQKPDQTLYRRCNLPPKVGAAPHPAAATFSP